MKILFVMRLAVPAHSWRVIITTLCQRGHHVTAIFDRRWSEIKRPPILDELTEELRPRFLHVWALHRKNFWRYFAFPARQILGYRRYFFTKQSAFFRSRWMGLFPGWLRTLMRLPFAETIVTSRVCGRFLEWVEKNIPPDPAIRDQIASFHPDAVVVPIANMRYGCVDSDYLVAARSLGIPIAGFASSWDSVTTKGIFRPIPDVMLVWNQTQARQTVEHHSIPQERIRVAGATSFDKWFNHGLTLTPRGQFCQTHGLQNGDSMILYLGATRNIAADETIVIRELREALDRADDQRLRRVQIIVRPHPAHAGIYDSLDIHDTIVVPRGGSAIYKQSAQQLFYDCSHHAVIAVGIYTSAMMDTILVGRPVAALLRPEYAETQAATEYFQGLCDSGVLPTPRSFDELFALVKKLLDGDQEYLQKREKFIDNFIRPRGRAVPASIRFAEELEALTPTPRL